MKMMFTGLLRPAQEHGRDWAGKSDQAPPVGDNLRAALGFLF